MFENFPLHVAGTHQARQQQHRRQRTEIHRVGRRGLMVESLEARRLLAANLFAPLAFADSSTIQVSDFKQQVIQEPVGDSIKGTHRYWVDGDSQEMRLSVRRLAVQAIDPVRESPELLAEYGLSIVRDAGPEFQVVDSSRDLDAAAVQRLIGSGLVERVVPVFLGMESNFEAVLLNEAIVSLQPGLEPEAFFQGHEAFANYRRADGTPDQYVVTLSAGYGEQALDAIGQLQGDPRLKWAEPNFYQDWQRHFFPDDTRFDSLWHLHNTGQSGGLVDADSDLPEAWDVLPGGSSELVIGIVDDGVPDNHPDLNVWVNPGEVPFNAIDDDGNGWVDDINGWNFVADNNLSGPNATTDEHGTAVAGVAAALGNNALGVTGASYGSQVLSSKIFEGSGVASDVGIAAAIYYAAGRTRNGLGTWKSADLSNHSWGGGGSSSAINEALTWATSQGRQGQGSTQVFAAGNSSALVGYPATQASVNPGLIVVGAMNNFGELSDYSSFGPLIDVVTPSNDTRPGYLAIDTTDRVGLAGYANGDYTGTGSTGFGGTSSAAPLATGITALAIAQGELLGIDFSPQQLRDLVRVNTDLVADQSYDTATGKTFFTGYGSLNAGSLLRGIGEREISITTTDQEVESGVTSVDLGTIVAGTAQDVSFRIRNQGTLTLNLQSISVTGDGFSILEPPADSELGLGESTVVTVRFAPPTGGNYQATVSVLSDDSDESESTFVLNGEALTPTVVGRVYEDWDGDGSLDDDESTLAGRRVYLDENGNQTYDTTQNVFQSNPSAPILDGATTSSTIAVSGLTSEIADLNVQINISHTWVADLVIELVGPGGQRITLAQNVGLDGDNFNGTIFDDSAATSITSGSAPFPGSYRPEQPLSVFNGLSANGDWKLEVTDEFFEDQGSVNSWGLTILTGEISRVTDSLGTYNFLGLPVGDHSLRSDVPTDWTSSGASGFDFTVNSGNDSFTGVHFGQAKRDRFYAEIFDDADANGIIDEGELGVEGSTLVWDKNGDGDYDPEQATLWSNNNPVGILDLVTVTSTIPVAMPGAVIADVNVTVNIVHTWNEDLDVFLIAPDGTRVELFTDVGGLDDDFINTVLDDQAASSIVAGTAPFTGRFRPEGSLASLNGKLASGNWVLEIRDDTNLDQGTLLNWSVELTASGDPAVSSNASGRAALDLTSGPQSIFVLPDPDWAFTLPADGNRQVDAIGVPLFDQTFGMRRRPLLEADAANVNGAEGQVVSATGTWGAAYAAEEITLDASHGAVDQFPDGTWTWSWSTTDNQSALPVTITATDPLGITQEVILNVEIENESPSLTVTQTQVAGNVLSTLTNSGTWADVLADTVTLSASSGNVVKNVDGTWTWSLVPSTRLVNEGVTITATDEDGGETQLVFEVTALVAVVNRQVFYNGSGFESNGGVNASLSASKLLLRSNASSQTTTSANVINYSRGINGVVLDVAGLESTNLTVSDFVFRVSPAGASGVVDPSTWAAAPTPTAIAVTGGTSTTPARIRLEWADNAIQNTWFQIIVQANSNTGLLEREVYYLGHALGDVDYAGPSHRVTTTDVGLVRSGVSNDLVGVEDPRDVNKDRRVTTTDVSYVRARVANTVLLRTITVPPAGSGGEGEGGASYGPQLPDGKLQAFDACFARLAEESF